MFSSTALNIDSKYMERLTGDISKGHSSDSGIKLRLVYIVSLFESIQFFL